MPEFSKINHVYTPEQKMKDIELVRAVKFAIVSEFEAIQIYQEIAEAIAGKTIKKCIIVKGRLVNLIVG